MMEIKKNFFSESHIGIAANDGKCLNLIDASTFVDSAKLQSRDWIVPRLCLRGYMSMLIAPGATGKSIFVLTVSISVAIGRDLLGLGGVKKGRVLVVNNEDDVNELHRRVAAICNYYSVSESELNGNLYLYSGYEEKLMVSQEIEGQVVAVHSDIDALEREIETKDLDLVVLDPLVSVHQSNENDNVKMDHVVALLKRLSGRTKVGLWVVHHTRKLNGLKMDGEADIGRGASAIKDAARVVFNLYPIDEETAKAHGIPIEDMTGIIGLRDSKTNFTPKSWIAKWFRIQSTTLANNESVGIPVRYSMPDKLEKNGPTAETKKTDVRRDFASIMYKVTEGEGGEMKAVDIRGEYKLTTNVGNTTFDDHVKLLPLGSTKSVLYNFSGKSFRLYRTKQQKRTAPHMIHLEAQ